MNPFYGGMPGQSFYIKAIFTSKNGIANSIKHDLSLGWTSPISENEFVIVSYGLPSDPNYDIYKQIDIDAEGKVYNSTLWQKCYDETKGNASGWYYKLVASMTGNTPRFSVNQPIVVLDADEDPTVTLDGSDIDHPILFFSLPQSQVLSLNQPINILDVDEKPRVVFDEGTKDSNGDLIPGQYGGTINRPTFTMWLPQSQVIRTAIVEQTLDVDKLPEVRLDINEDGTINQPVIKFKLPVSQKFLEDNISHEVLDADDLPFVTFDDTNINEPSLVFHLPQSQVMDDPETSVIDPMDAPAVSDIGTVNNPKLRFDLPRAVRFYYGNLLGERTAGRYTLTNPLFSDYGVGDYYINAATGFIYLISSKADTTCVFDYVACIQSPLPDVQAEGMSPYTDDLQLAIPEVTRDFLDNEKTKWILKFKLPKAPTPAVNVTFVGSQEEGSANVEITDKDTITFNFEIPTGSKVYAGLEVDTGKFDAVVTGAKPGDLYVNSNTGKVYILNKAMIWEVKEGSLKGPVGDALHIVRDYKIEETDTIKDSLQTGVDYILDNYKDEDGNSISLSPDEIFSVTWLNIEEQKETSYWYYYTEEGKWGRVQLTGGITNLIETVYNPEEDGPVDNKTYSISYINSLIGGNLDLDKLDKTAFSKDQIFDMLSWGSFEDAKKPSPIPEPENHDTLSAEEVIELMSWGSISKLQVNAQP